MRINARLDEDRTRKFEFLARITSLGTSEVLKRAIDVYYEQMRAAQTRLAEILARTGFVGCGEASEDLSETYKQQAGIIREKASGEWPRSIAKLAGAWADMPEIAELRAAMGEDVPREPI